MYDEWPDTNNPQEEHNLNMSLKNTLVRLLLYRLWNWEIGGKLVVPDLPTTSETWNNVKY